VITTAETIVQRVGDLPTLPAIHAQIVALGNSASAEAADLQRVIEVDPVLASKLIGLVNSAFYGLSVEIVSIERAVMILGFKGVVQLALSTALVDLFVDEGDGGFDYAAFWDHSIATAVAARRIAKASSHAGPEEALLAGLVHDLGRLVNARALPDESREAATQARDEGRHLFLIERSRLGFDHADTGRALVSDWGLPAAVTAAVGDHHEPSREGTPAPMTAVVHLAEIVAAAAGIGDEGDGFVPPLDPRAWDTLGLTLRDLGPLLDGLDAESALLREMIRG